jgi:hypothetical protein
MDKKPTTTKKATKTPVVDIETKTEVKVAVTKTKDVEIINLKYGDWGGYNSPHSNERKVELPIVFWFVEKYKDNLIELGEVSCFYRDANHPIYDLRSEKPTTTVMDICDVDYEGKNVVSVSTIEHVGNGDYGYPKDPEKVLNLLQKIMKQSKNYLLTFPVGFNRKLEKTITDQNMKYILLVRDEKNNWTQVHDKKFDEYEYNKPYGAGNAVAILTNLNIGFTLGD